LTQDGAIGVFDSGIGGLTVLKELLTRLPGESFVYFGDTARVPYGTKSVETVLRFSRENVTFLLDQSVKFIVVACNTASASAVPRLQREFRIPIVGVIEPGVRAKDLTEAETHRAIAELCKISSRIPVVVTGQQMLLESGSDHPSGFLFHDRQNPFGADSQVPFPCQLNHRPIHLRTVTLEKLFAAEPGAKIHIVEVINGFIKAAAHDFIFLDG